MTNLDELVLKQAELDKVHECRECGERGRAKGVLSFRGELRLFCHDEEKSCYNYVLMRAQQGILRVG
jgi:hypothetical protein